MQGLGLLTASRINLLSRYVNSFYCVIRLMYPRVGNADLCIVTSGIPVGDEKVTLRRPSTEAEHVPRKLQHILETKGRHPMITALIPTSSRPARLLAATCLAAAATVLTAGSALAAPASAGADGASGADNRDTSWHGNYRAENGPHDSSAQSHGHDRPDAGRRDGGPCVPRCTGSR